MPQPGVEVLNENPLAFPTDVKIAVMNRNNEMFPRTFDGEPYEFFPGEANIITCETAFAIFAVESRTPPGKTIRLIRDKNYGPGGNANSFYIEAALAVGMNTPEKRKYFDNFEFRLVKSVKKLAAVDFDRLALK